MPRGSWRFISLLHNLALDASVGNDQMAIVPLSDVRLKQYWEIKDFERYVGAFKDQYGRQHEPSVLIGRGRLQRKPEAVLAFRNALAISAVARAWERFLALDSQNDPFKFSDYFDFYPHLPTRDFSGLVVNTASVMGYDSTDEFSGQVAPELGHSSHRTEFYDAELFGALLERWEARHRGGRTREPTDEALFRSLEMAFRAARVPHANRGSIGDYGAAISLWVSAFEILAWPKNQHARTSDVLHLLRPASVVSKRLARRHYKALVPGKGSTPQPVTLMEKLYCEMYHARNAFLHGNPVTVNTLFPSQHSTRLTLLCFAPVLYKCALYTVLRLWDAKLPGDDSEIGLWASRRMMRSFLQDALLASTGRRESRRERLARTRGGHARGVTSPPTSQ
jgi:hypothetical protein